MWRSHQEQARQRQPGQSQGSQDVHAGIGDRERHHGSTDSAGGAERGQEWNGQWSHDRERPSAVKRHRRRGRGVRGHPQPLWVGLRYELHRGAFAGAHSPGCARICDRAPLLRSQEKGCCHIAWQQPPMTVQWLDPSRATNPRPGTPGSPRANPSAPPRCRAFPRRRWDPSTSSTGVPTPAFRATRGSAPRSPEERRR